MGIFPSQKFMDEALVEAVNDSNLDTTVVFLRYGANPLYNDGQAIRLADDMEQHKSLRLLADASKPRGPR